MLRKFFIIMLRTFVIIILTFSIMMLRTLIMMLEVWAKFSNDPLLFFTMHVFPDFQRSAGLSPFFQKFWLPAWAQNEVLERFKWLCHALRHRNAANAPGPSIHKSAGPSGTSCWTQEVPGGAHPGQVSRSFVWFHMVYTWFYMISIWFDLILIWANMLLSLYFNMILNVDCLGDFVSSTVILAISAFGRELRSCSRTNRYRMRIPRERVIRHF